MNPDDTAFVSEHEEVDGAHELLVVGRDARVPSCASAWVRTRLRLHSQYEGIRGL